MEKAMSRTERSPVGNQASDFRPEISYAVEDYIAAKCLLDRISPYCANAQAELQELAGSRWVDFVKNTKLPEPADESAIWLLQHCARILSEPQK